MLAGEVRDRASPAKQQEDKNMFDKTYRNKAGKSFTEGKKFRINDFFDYYNTLTIDEWDEAIRMAAKRGVDISNIKPYIRIYGHEDDFLPLEFVEIREKLIAMHCPDNPMTWLPAAIISREEQRKEIEDLYASLGVPVPDFWKRRLW